MSVEDPALNLVPMTIIGYRHLDHRHPVHVGGRKTTRIGLAVAGRKAGVVSYVMGDG